MKNVLISITSSTNSMRECLIGIFNYVNAGRDWSLKILPDPEGATSEGLTLKNVDNALASGLHGVITGLGLETPAFHRLLEAGIPMVLNNTPPDWSPGAGDPITILRNDDLLIGRRGFRYLQSRGNFRSYAFIPADIKCFWSTYRQRGFGLECNRWKADLHVFNLRHGDLEDWLLALPKPVAIMAVSDREAVNVIEACRRIKLRIPEQVAILGVDNDELYCKSAKPQLSSIHPNHLELGRCMAMELDRLMRGRKPHAEIVIAPIRVVERESTRTIPPAGHMIKSAISFIKDNYGNGITVRDVASHLGVSEALLRLRFRTVNGRSLRDMLLETRLKAAQDLLRRTNKPVSEISRLTGFSSVCRFTHFFHERVGLSPLKWRADVCRTKAL